MALSPDAGGGILGGPAPAAPFQSGLDMRNLRQRGRGGQANVNGAWRLLIGQGAPAAPPLPATGGIPMRRAVPAVALALAAALPAAAQNTAADWAWAVDRFERFGIWESVCDHRNVNGVAEKRCYIAHVDVFSPQPLFAAAFVFVTPVGPSQLRFEFSFEPGTRFAGDAVALLRDGVRVWGLAAERCNGLTCVLEGAAADELARAMAAGGELRLAMTDRHGFARDLRWNASGFAEARADMALAAAERGL
jgi:invasion protein IalB